ncbi:hypothetical protein [Roseomonas genomospecies 6]|uniref:Tetratricopeptide repeat protein n=1 Tax=Roseomonas genomospecies 6 TaxID=214106 RepID=A0A9W7NHM0_9PROT|nr:hypothetical protein [Roseomonas genomospecies 6]KAA0678936.1 hypothetical protein DS843_17610 [Roseomonas genomospecies 6]
MPTRTRRAIAGTALAGAVLLAGGCATSVPAPDTVYRQALEEAVVAGRCEGPTVEALWAAYDRWFAVAASLASYHRATEAGALLRQGEAFRILGCPAAARETYETLLQRFPDPDYELERNAARRGLMDLPINPPAPLLRPAPAVTSALRGPTSADHGDG